MVRFVGVSAYQGRAACDSRRGVLDDRDESQDLFMLDRRQARDFSAFEQTGQSGVVHH